MTPNPISSLQRMIARRPRPESSRLPAPFILGAGRSGTTLLRLMLDAHPDLAIPPETHFIPKVSETCAGASNPRDAFVQALIADERWADFGIRPEDLTERVRAIEPFSVGEGLRAFFALYAARFQKSRWGDKTPPYVLYMDVIQGFLPEAHFIHMIRDGRDVTLSIKNLWFGPNSVQEGAQWWVERIRRARAQAAHLAHYMELRYEDLVATPEASLARVCDFIQLPWNPGMLDYYKTAEERIAELDRIEKEGGRGVVEASDRRAIHALTSKPPQANRAGRWRTEMTADDLRKFESAAGDLLQELGYEVHASAR